MASELGLKLHLDATYRPAILDLEGAVPYDMLLQVRRGASDLTRPMNILTDESLFDIPHAFTNGLLKLIDLDSKEQADLGFLSTSPKPTARPKIVTLQPRAPRLPLFKHDLVIPLRINTHIISALTAGHKYRVELGTRDLGIKWWNYGDNADLELQASTSSLPPAEPAKLVVSKSTSTYTHDDFSVVNSLLKPPTISISMSLSSNIVHRSRSPPTTLRAVITNEGDRTITLRSSEDQVFIGPWTWHEAWNTPNNHRITSAKPRTPSIDNFSITKISTGEEFSPEPKHTCSVTAGSGGKSRRGLTTLEPGVPLTQELVLFDTAYAFLNRMGNDDDFRLRLRPLGVWWCAGTLDEIFDGQPTIKKMPGPCLPLILQSDDELQFRLED